MAPRVTCLELSGTAMAPTREVWLQRPCWTTGPALSLLTRGCERSLLLPSPLSLPVRHVGPAHSSSQPQSSPRRTSPSTWKIDTTRAPLFFPVPLLLPTATRALAKTQPEEGRLSTREHLSALCHLPMEWKFLSGACVLPNRPPGLPAHTLRPGRALRTTPPDVLVSQLPAAGCAVPSQRRAWAWAWCQSLGGPAHLCKREPQCACS